MPMCAVDDPAHSNFILPAVHRSGRLALAVSTGGASPALASRIRDELAAHYGPEYAALADLLGEMRPAVTAALAGHEARGEFWKRALDAGLLEEFRAGGKRAARKRLRQLLEDYTTFTKSQGLR
jgi:precorrin-2 dehydrogenase/sirohydrochlorin ferrochelatase